MHLIASAHTQIRRFTRLHLRAQIAAAGVFAASIAGLLSAATDKAASVLQPHTRYSAQQITNKAAVICTLFTGDAKTLGAPILGGEPLFNSMYHRKVKPVWKIFGESAGRQVDLLFDDETGQLDCYSIQLKHNSPASAAAKYLQTPVEAAAHADRLLRDSNILPRHSTIALEAMPKSTLKGDGWSMVWIIRKDAKSPATKIKMVLESSDGQPLLIINPYLPFSSR